MTAPRSDARKLTASEDRERRLLKFARQALATMERHKDWDADVMQKLSEFAYDLDLADDDAEGFFKVKR